MCLCLPTALPQDHKRSDDGSGKCNIIETGSQEDCVYGVVLIERLSKLNQLSSATPVIPPSVLNWLQEECELIDVRALGSSSD
jgi:hypothetical protein